MGLCCRIVTCLGSRHNSHRDYQVLALVPTRPFPWYFLRSQGMFVLFPISDYPALFHHLLTSSPPSSSDIRPSNSPVQTIFHIIITLKPSSPNSHLILIVSLNSSWQRLIITANGPVLLRTRTRKSITSVQTQALRHPRMTYEFIRPTIPSRILIRL